MLELYNLKKLYNGARQELTTALYQHDAACRVIARLVKERDQARGELMQVGGGKVSANVANAEQDEGDAMEVEAQGPSLPESLVKTLDETYAKLSATRKKRKTPADLPTAEDIAAYTMTKKEQFKKDVVGVASLRMLSFSLVRP